MVFDGDKWRSAPLRTRGIRKYGLLALIGPVHPFLPHQKGGVLVLVRDVSLVGI